MMAGCIVLAAILFSIVAAAIRSVPSFARHVRIGLLLAEGRDLQYLRLARQARVIPFRSSRRAA